MEKLPVIMINVRLPAQLIGTFLLILVSSCVTTRKTTYLQENEMGSSDSLTRPDSMELVYKLQPGDNLFIRVVTPDPRWAEMFNTLPVTAGSVAAGPESVLSSFIWHPTRWKHPCSISWGCAGCRVYGT